MLISQVHTHTFSSILMIKQTPRQMEINHLHQSCTYTYTLFNTQVNTDAMADADTLFHQSGTHIHTLSLILMIKHTPRQMDIHHIHQSGTHSYHLFNTHDNTDATADGDKSFSSVMYIHIHSL